MAIKSYWCTNDTNSSVKSKHVLALISFSILTRIFPAQIWCFWDKKTEKNHCNKVRYINHNTESCIYSFKNEQEIKHNFWHFVPTDINSSKKLISCTAYVTRPEILGTILLFTENSRKVGAVLNFTNSMHKNLKIL